MGTGEGKAKAPSINAWGLAFENTWFLRPSIPLRRDFLLASSSATLATPSSVFVTFGEMGL